MNKATEPTLKGYPVGFGAPTYKILMENWRALNQLLGPVVKRRNVQEMRLELITGGSMDFWSLDNPDMIRGRKYKRFVINEAGFVKDLMELWNYILRPTLVDYEGDMVIGGTPKGRNGFWQMFQWGLDPTMSNWSAFQMSSYENPYIPKSELDDMVKSLPERVVQQEIYAQFLDDAGGVFRRVMDAATAEEQDKAVHDDYVIGVDWGKHNDFTVFSVIDAQTKSLVYLDRFNQIDYMVQVSRLKALSDRFHPLTIIAESNSMGEPLIEQLQRDGLPVQAFTTTNASKTQAIDALALAFERTEIKILPDPVLIGELQAYEMERLPSGLLRYSAPEGMHDDTVMSLALAWHGVEGGPLILFGA